MRPSFAGPIPRRAAQWLLIVLFGIVSLALAVAGYRYYREQERIIRAERYNDLAAVADLKVGQIVQWRQERLADANLYATGMIRTLLLQWLAAPNDDVLPATLLERARSYANTEDYGNVILSDTDGRILLTLDNRLTELETATRQLVSQAIATGRPVFGDFLLCPICGEIHLDVAAPILDEDQRPVAVLILRTDPETYLYPLIQSWPTPSQSAETLLVRRDGGDVLFLNALRHSSAPPLTLRIPLSRADVPAVQAAAYGLTGEVEGHDYRGVDVLSMIHPVPGTSWFMIAKVDRDEILAEVRYRGQVILTLVVLAILMAGIAAVGIYLYRQRHLYRKLFRAEQAQRQAQEEIRTTLYSIGDGVIATDATGRVMRMNPVAEALTGWREVDAAGQPLAQVFRIVNEETHAEVENPAERVLREGVVVGLANHTLLIARDGTEHPIVDSGAAIRDEQGAITGVVLVFRDQTEERAAQRALHAAGVRWQTTFDAMLDPVALMNADGTVAQCNRAFATFVGTGSQGVVGHKCYQLVHQTEDHVLGCPLVRARKSGKRETMELTVGERIFLVVIDPVKTAGGQVIGLVHIMRDITERKAAETQLNDQLKELRRWHTVTLDRETRIFDLKREVNELLTQAGHPSRYPSAEGAVDG